MDCEDEVEACLASLALHKIPCRAAPPERLDQFSIIYFCPEKQTALPEIDCGTSIEPPADGKVTTL